jgi:hypothetical protein
MCFSAEASFIGGAVIIAIGVVTVKTIHKKSQLLFAAIPLFFGIQQMMEGLLWLTIPYTDYGWAQSLSKYAFLTMANVLWPVMIPLSVLFMEENPKRKKTLRIFLITGIALSLYYAYCLVFFHVTPVIINYHIHYENDFPGKFSIIAFLIYLAATIPPLFVSSVKRMYLFGGLLAFSCLVTAIFFTQYLTSVWCFFAALISALIFWILKDAKIKFRLDKQILSKISMK